MYKATVNKDQEYQINPKEEQDWCVQEVKKDSYHIIKDFKSYNAEVVEADLESKVLKIKVNGNVYEVAVKDKMDLLLESLGMDAQLSSKVNEIKAPMPGLVLDVKVAVGDEIQKGDPVLVLEAMKMENMIKAPGEGTVQAIEIKQGDAVEKNEVLIRLS